VIQPVAHERGKSKEHRSERGVALLMVLWILTILMVLVLSFSFLTRTEANSTLFFRHTVQKKFYAEAGMERAIMEVLFRLAHKSSGVVLEGKEVLRVDGMSYKGEMGKGSYAFRLIDEAGKININQMTDVSGVILSNLLVNLGIQKEDADTIVDSILDWKDADDLHRLHGAESDYYMSLPNPYKAKDGPFDTVEELLLVKGMKPEILYGNKERKGIISYLTVYGAAPKINANAAAKEVLAAIPGLTAEMVDAIMEQRKTAEFRALAELQAIPGVTLPTVAPYIDVAESNTFSLESAGFVEGAKKGYGIRAVVTVEAADKYTYLYYKSPAETKE
jgi:general secretion pathway protein K